MPFPFPSSSKRWIFLAAAACAWAYVVLAVVGGVVPVVQRYFLGVPGMDLDAALFQVAPWLLMAALVLGFVPAWELARGGPVERSSLAVWPGWPLAAAGLVLVALGLGFF